ncbi:ABC transporter ATP-binding protein [Azospirillum canadense]|uniref:ABC transporter ATP-binding protein n=1 Tax=Azospirillum canadense TaxID=403962 RepID=UPI0022271F93|nr:ABC transporter ATP-binding protein [Azospirillum canadense]MCW2239409.1 branched-chain amino acid transport system ATP-binding protein [Azospirillum canadense]
MPEPLLEVRDLAGGYGDVQVLWGIDLVVEEREIACVVGSNGAGKTTLLRTISGMLRPTAGMIRFAGRDLAGAAPDAVLGAGIAHVPEGRRLFRGLSVRDNLLLGAYTRSDGRAAVERDLAFVYDVFPILKERRNQDATTLSGGEQQMCAIGRGIMAQPKLLMIDEMSLGLAPRAVEVLGEALAGINRRGLTILLVEQDVITAFDLARHGFVVDMGRITISGNTATLSTSDAMRGAYLGSVAKSEVG